MFISLRFVSILFFVLYSTNAFCEFFKSKDSVQIHYIKRISTIKTSKKSIVFVHGRNEFLQKYDHFYDYLNKEGFNVYAPDLRGQGSSEGKRCYIDNYSQYSDDLSRFIEIIKNDIGKDGNLILVSHSTGGLISLKFLQEYKEPLISKAILSSPFLGLKHSYPVFLIKILVKLKLLLGSPDDLVSSDAKDLPFDENVLTHNKDLYLKYYNSDLKCGSPTYAWLAASFAAQKDIFNNENIKKIQIPLVMLLAGNDQVVDINSSKDFCKKQNKCGYKEYKNSYHELLNELNYIDIFDDIKKNIIND